MAVIDSEHAQTPVHTTGVFFCLPAGRYAEAMSIIISFGVLGVLTAVGIALYARHIARHRS